MVSHPDCLPDQVIPAFGKVEVEVQPGQVQQVDEQEQVVHPPGI